MLRSNNIYNPINNKFVYFDKYKTFHQHEEMGLIPNDSIVFVGEGLTKTDGPFIWTHGKIFGAAGIIEYIHNFVNNNATSINAALAEQLAQLKAQIDAEHKSIADDANAALDKVKQDLEAAEEKIKWLQEHGSDEDKIEHLMAILYDEIGKVNADLVEYNKRISAINGIIEETFAKYDIDDLIEDKYSNIINLVKGYVQEELRKVNLDERIVQVVGRYMESGLLKDYVTYALLSDEKTITSLAEQLLEANETFASLKDWVSWRSKDDQDLIETIAALKLYVDNLKGSWLLDAEWNGDEDGFNRHIAALFGEATKDESFIKAIADQIIFETSRFLFKSTGSKNCILIDDKGIRHFIDEDGDGIWDGEPTEHSNFFLGTDGSGWLGALKGNVWPIVWDSAGNVKIQKELIFDGNDPFDWDTVGSYVEQAFTVADEKDVLDASCLPQNEVWPASKLFTRTIGSKTYVWTKSATNLLDGQKIWMAQRRVKNNGTLLKNGLSNWEGPYCISGAGGVLGVDDDWIKFIYTKTNGTKPTLPQRFTTGTATSGSYTWYDNATDNAVTLSKNTTVWMAYSMVKNSNEFTSFLGPILWAQWGHDAIDGDGVQYIFCVTNSTFNGNWPEAGDGDSYNNPHNWPAKGTSQTLGEEYIETRNVTMLWHDNPQELHSGETQWVCVRTYKHDTGWSEYSQPSVWAYYAKDGVTSGYIVDFSNSNIPVTTDENGYLHAEFDHSVKVFAYTSVGGSIPLEEDPSDSNLRYTVELGDPYVATSRPYAPGQQLSPWYEVNISGNTVQIQIHEYGTEGMETPESLRDKHLYIPVVVTIKPDGNSNNDVEITKEISVYGVYTGADGVPGLVMDLRCDTNSISRDRYNPTINEPESITPYVYFALGTTVYDPMYATDHSGVLPTGISHGDFEIDYKRGSNGSWTALTGTDSISSSGGTDTSTPLYLRLLYKGTEIDAQTISYTLSGPRGETVNGIGKFLSTVFCRTNTTPKKPEGGSWPDGIPEDTQVYDTSNNPISNVAWHDGLPSGDAKLWASLRIFFSDGSHEGTTQWSDPIEMTDIKNLYDVEFSTEEQYSGDPDNAPGEWFDPTTKKYKDDSVSNPHVYSGDWTDVIWRAEQFVINGEVTPWIITKIKGEKGDPGKSKFASTIFCRCRQTPIAPAWTLNSNHLPVAGIDDTPTYEEPWPHGNNASVKFITGSGNSASITNVTPATNWTDGIPDGEYTLWACTGWFDSESDGITWSEPRQMTDTETWDVEFSFEDGDSAPSEPVYDSFEGVTNNPYNAYGPNTSIRTYNTNIKWFDPALDTNNLPTGKTWSDAVWRAERSKKNGVWGDWTIIRIKGEQGPSGDGYYVKIGDLEGSVVNIPYDNLGRKEGGDITLPIEVHFGGQGAVDTSKWVCAVTANGLTENTHYTYNASDRTITIKDCPESENCLLIVTTTITLEDNSTDIYVSIIQVKRIDGTIYSLVIEPSNEIKQNTTTKTFGGENTKEIRISVLTNAGTKQNLSNWWIFDDSDSISDSPSINNNCWVYILSGSASYSDTILFKAAPKTGWSNQPNEWTKYIHSTLLIDAHPDPTPGHSPDPNIDYKLVVDGTAKYDTSKSSNNLEIEIKGWAAPLNMENEWSTYISNIHPHDCKLLYKATLDDWTEVTNSKLYPNVITETSNSAPGSILFVLKDYDNQTISYCYMPVTIIPRDGSSVDYDSLDYTKIANNIGNLDTMYVMDGEYDPSKSYTTGAYTSLVYFHEQGESTGYWWKLIKDLDGNRYAPGNKTVYFDTATGGDKVVDYIGRKFVWSGAKNQYDSTTDSLININEYWERVDKFNTIITDAIFAKFAKLGSAIICGDYMFSLHGTIDGLYYGEGSVFKTNPEDGSETPINPYLMFNPCTSMSNSSKCIIYNDANGITKTVTGTSEKVDTGIKVFVGVKKQGCHIHILDKNKSAGLLYAIGTSGSNAVNVPNDGNLANDNFDNFRGLWCNLYIYNASNTGSNVTNSTTITQVYVNCVKMLLEQIPGTNPPRYRWVEFLDDDNATVSTDFKPNWCVDLKTGKMIAGRGNFVVDPDGAINVGHGNFTVSNSGNVSMKGNLTSGSTITGANITSGTMNVGNGKLVVNSEGVTFSGTLSGIKNKLVVQHYDKLELKNSHVIINPETDIYVHFSEYTPESPIGLLLPQITDDIIGKTITLYNPFRYTLHLGVNNGENMPNNRAQIGYYCDYSSGSNTGHSYVNYFDERYTGHEIPQDSKIVFWCDPRLEEAEASPTANIQPTWTILERIN